MSPQYTASTTSYLLTVASFKLALGAIFLLVGWESLHFEGREILTIAVATGLSFLPAAFAKPLFQKVAARSATKTITVFLLLSAVLVATLPFLRPMSPWALGSAYFVTWILFFVLEAALERWFMGLAAKGSREDATRLSSLSTAIIQVSVICGPLFIASVKSLTAGVSLPFFMISLFLGCGAVVAALAPADAIEPVKAKGEAVAPPAEGKWLSIVALASIWPAIAIFNMVIPIIAKNYLASGLDGAAWLEFVFGGAMAVTGFGLAALKRRFPGLDLAMVALPLAALGLGLFAVGFQSEALALTATGIIGICYGFMRIEIRAALAMRYSAVTAGSIVASANALSAPFVLIAVMIGYREYTTMSDAAAYNLTLPAIFGLSMLLLHAGARARLSRAPSATGSRSAA